jgi:glutaryl-CoA dehydrogenase
MSLTRAASRVVSSMRALSTAAPVADVKLVPTKGPLGKYQQEDPFLMMSSQLSSDEKMIQEAARAYCQTELMPRILMGNRNEVFDRNIMKVRERVKSNAWLT